MRKLLQSLDLPLDDLSSMLEIMSRDSKSETGKAFKPKVDKDVDAEVREMFDGYMERRCWVCPSDPT